MPDTLYADAGYDAEWIHAQCREEWGAENVIKPAVHRADGKRNGIWRSGMSKNYLAKMQYGRRWAVETFFSRLKRTMDRYSPPPDRNNCSKKPPSGSWPTA